MLGILLKAKRRPASRLLRASGLRMALVMQRQRSTNVRIGNPADYRMLRIEKETDGCVSKLKLSGRIQSGCITRIRAVLNDGCARKILDLREITLVDIEVVRFLIRCENEGIELLECPLYVREWMLRERAEGAQPQNP